MLNSAVAAALFEEWADSRQEAIDMILSGRIILRPAQDFGVVTPLAFVVSPQIPVLRVEDRNGVASPRFSPVNDGTMPGALRFGDESEGRLERLRRLASIGSALDAALARPIPLLPIMQTGLAGGDDLHGRVGAANRALANCLIPRLVGDARDHVAGASHFVLNALMSACAMMIGAGEGIPGSRMVTRAGANGVRLGWSVAGSPDAWITTPAEAPRGPRRPGCETAPALPAIGDSVVIDACGFGAAAVRASPDLTSALRGHCSEAFFDDRASQPFLAAHPSFGPALRLGLDLARPWTARGIILGMLDASGEKGLIGQGLAPWPDLDGSVSAP